MNPCTCPPLEARLAAEFEHRDRHLCDVHDAAEIEHRRIETARAEAERRAQLTDDALARLTPSAESEPQPDAAQLVAQHLAAPAERDQMVPPAGPATALNDDAALAAIVGAPLHNPNH